MNHITKLNQLLHGITLQSMERPLDLLHHMKNLIGLDGKFFDDSLKKLYLDRMPANVPFILAANYELNLHDLAVKADCVFMFSNSMSLIFKILPLAEITSHQQDAEFQESLCSSNYQSFFLFCQKLDYYRPVKFQSLGILQKEHLEWLCPDLSPSGFLRLCTLSHILRLKLPNTLLGIVLCGTG